MNTSPFSPCAICSLETEQLKALASFLRHMCCLKSWNASLRCKQTCSAGSKKDPLGVESCSSGLRAAMLLFVGLTLLPGALGVAICAGSVTTLNRTIQYGMLLVYHEASLSMRVDDHLPR